MTTPRKSAAPKRPTALERLTAEAKANGSTLCTFNGKTYVVLPFTEWDKKAIRYMRELDYYAWAEAVMAPAVFAEWDEAVKTNAEAMAFVEAWGTQRGESMGESSASPTS
jgi:hypothetical protein